MIFGCITCGREFKTQRGLSGHLRWHQNPETFSSSKAKQECVICGIQVSKSNISRHEKVCDGKSPIKSKTCPHCLKGMKSLRSAAQHVIRCLNNPNRTVTSSNLKHFNEQRHAGERVSWNKGLTKDTDSRVHQGVATRIEGYSSGRLTRSKYNHTNETRAHLSAVRTAFLKANPDKVPYKLNHYSNGESYPEKYFREILEKENVSFIAQKRVSLYSLDFVIGNIDLEIDGEQHYVDPRVVASDKRRTAYLNGMGYTVIRVRWATYKKMSPIEQQNFISALLYRLS